MVSAPYKKPYLTITQQLALIQSRGMGITDPTKASNYLERVGYYRLSGYWYPYRASPQESQFKPGTNFAEIVQLYIFDKMLRLLMLDVIERIEIALRVQITLQLGQYDPKAHRDPNLLHGNFARRADPKTGQIIHREWIRRVDEAFDNSREDFAKHFHTKYAGDDPPIWIAAELWDFGAMSVLFGGLNKKDQLAIAQKFNIPAFDIMETWIRAINVARNICAHHARLWNRPIVIQPKWPTAVAEPMLAHLVGNTHAQTRVYGIATMCAYLLRSINPTSQWTARFRRHIATFPQSTIIGVAAAGFVQNWDQESLWK
jgi:abortive infection bacteriophage resistance protein